MRLRTFLLVSLGVLSQTGLTMKTPSGTIKLVTLATIAAAVGRGARHIRTAPILPNSHTCQMSSAEQRAGGSTPA